MPLLNVRKGDDPTTVTLPAALLESLHLADHDTITWETNGDQIVLRRVEEAPAHQPAEPHHWTAEELLKLPLDERDRILAAQAALAEEEYRTNRDLTNFEAF